MQEKTAFPFAYAGEILAQLTQNTPLVHCLTNNVSKNFVANAVLAIGASPAMVESAEEVGDFSRHVDAMVINVGSLQPQHLQSMRMAAEIAHSRGIPWVFDPAAVGAYLPYRTYFAHEILTYHPSVVRGNASEIMHLAGEAAKSRGADSLNRTEEALQAGLLLAQKYRCVVVISGETDYILNGERILFTEGGHPFMTRVTGTGCALSAITAATVWAAEDPMLGAATACAVMKHAGEYAAGISQGTGSFATALLDALTLENYHATAR